jgi:hypothetical protein
MNRETSIPRPERLRTIEKPFAWLPFRLLKGGFFANLSDRAKLLYIFLCLVSDRQGTSFYGDDRIQSHFQIDCSDIALARTELIKKDLIAYDGRIYQVLSLPAPGQNTHPNEKSTVKQRTSEPELFSEILKRMAIQNR